MMSKLQNKRKAAGLSQAKLAQAADVSVRVIQHYEQGFRDINTAQAITVYKIAKALNVNIEDLLEIE